MSALALRPLSRAALAEAITLANRIFPDDIDSAEAPAAVYTASLEPDAYREEIKAASIRTLSYWVLPDYTGTLVGFTGLYTRLGDDPTVAWLGWFGVAPEARGRGLGRAILESTIAIAVARGFTALRLYTTDSPNEAVAQKLYEKLGFKVTRTERGEGFTTLYREKNLAEFP